MAKNYMFFVFHKFKGHCSFCTFLVITLEKKDSFISVIKWYTVLKPEISTRGLLYKIAMAIIFQNYQNAVSLAPHPIIGIFLFCELQFINIIM